MTVGVGMIGTAIFPGATIRALLELAIARQAIRQFVEIDEVPIELGAVHTRKFGFCADGNPAATTHSRAIDHHGVKRNDGADIEFARELRHGAHHGNRADGVDDVDFLSREHFARDIGNKTFATMTAVIGARQDRAVTVQFRFENNVGPRAAADDVGHARTAPV